MPGVAEGEDGLMPGHRNHIVRENIVSHVAVWIDAACVISDIVKRRSIRVGSCGRLLREPSLSPGHFGARFQP